MEIGQRSTRISRRRVLQGITAGTVGLTASAALGSRRSVVRAQGTPMPSGQVRLAGPTASPEEEQLLRQVLDNFSQAFPDIELSYEPVPANYLIKLQTDIAAGNAADVFYLQAEFAQDFMSRGVLLPIDDYMARDGVTAEDFYTPLISAYQWEGQTYGLPKDWSPLGMVYDQAAFTDASIQTSPTTWDELRTTLQTLLDANGQPALVIAPAFDRFIAFLFQAGGSVTNPEATEITLDSDATTEALEFFYGLYRDGLSTTPADAGAQWPGDALAQGTAKIVYEGNWMFPFLATNAPDKEVGIAELPAGPAGKGGPAFTNSYSIFGGTQNPDGAWALVNYLTGNEGMALWTSLGLAMPSRPGLMEQWLEQYPEREPYAAAGDYTTAVQYGLGGQKFSQDANAVLESLFAGQIDVAEAKAQLVTVAQTDIQLAQPS
jgi:multiple sugar transport system substrate-binding protein